MYVNNISKKVLGFGALTLVPGDTLPLPEGFDESHPTIKYLIENKFIVPVDFKSAVLTDEDVAAAKAKEQKAAQVAGKLKEINKMNLDALREEAAKLGAEYTDTDTKDALKKTITEKLQAE